MTQWGNGNSGTVVGHATIGAMYKDADKGKPRPNPDPFRTNRIISTIRCVADLNVRKALHTVDASNDGL